MYPMKKVACESSFNAFQRGAQITDYHKGTQFVDLSTIHSLDISFALFADYKSTTLSTTNM
ncbi:hypothetical protein T08_3942 [Trichinella sp. T8]|nr:hypothetical protein T08_3942 [Trichinella sp. T8]